MKYVNFHGYKVYENGVVIGKHGRPMKFFLTPKGYLITMFRVNGKNLTKSQHRIVAECFIPNPHNLSDVDHVDGVRNNNCVSNLRWVTHGENIKHSYNSERRSAKGENNARALITEDDVTKICEELQKGTRVCKIRDMGYAYHIVSSIKIRKNWKHVSSNYQW